jgi:predicted ABC-type ATPase
MGNSMSKNVPRVRMFAGPNGSGKSTIKSVIGRELLGVYVNPDEIEEEMRKKDFIDLAYYEIQTTADEVLGFFKKSPLLEKTDLLAAAAAIRFGDDKLIFHDAGVNTYFASVVADFIRSRLLDAGKSFTFETVMSYPDKVEVLRKAQSKGYRTYLYYIATEDPDINISRVQYRISIGGHSVPKDKIVERYKRSLDLLVQAVQASNRAYIFDNSLQQPLLVAEITNGRILEMKTDQMPGWFKRSLGNKLFAS